MIPAAPLMFALVALLAVWCVLVPFRRIGRAAAKHPLAAFVAFVFILYGAVKPDGGPIFSFENGLRNDGSFATNDTVHVEWVKTGAPYVPDSATLYVDFRERGSTNEWEKLAETTVGAYSIDINLVNATNYNYNVWYYYVPPEPVVTNGVWKYATQPAKAAAPENTFSVLPLKARTEGDGSPIATPGQKGEK